MSADDKFIREHYPRIEDLFITRRQFLQRAGMGFGMLGLAGLLGQELILEGRQCCGDLWLPGVTVGYRKLPYGYCGLPSDVV